MEVQKLLWVVKTQTQYLMNKNKDKIENKDNKSIKMSYIYMYIDLNYLKIFLLTLDAFCRANNILFFKSLTLDCIWPLRSLILSTLFSTIVALLLADIDVDFAKSTGRYK